MEFKYISYALNIILAVALFFKSALNEMLKEYWQLKRKKAEERKESIRQLKDELSENFAVLMRYREMCTVDDPTQWFHEFKETLEEAAISCDKILAAVNIARTHLKDDIMTEIVKYVKVVADIAVEIEKDTKEIEDIAIEKDSKIFIEAISPDHLKSIKKSMKNSHEMLNKKFRIMTRSIVKIEKLLIDN